jgi:hypothetical protein
MKDERAKDPRNVSRGRRAVSARRLNFSPARGLDQNDVALAAWTYNFSPEGEVPAQRAMRGRAKTVFHDRRDEGLNERMKDEG